MSHLVAPSSFRLGKTQPWYNNVLLGTKDAPLSGDATATAGLTKVAGALLRRKRLYVVKSTVVDKHGSRPHHRLLFVPRIKIRPREHSIGSFLRKSLLKCVALDTAAPRFKRYADLRKDKAAKIRRRPRPRRLNRWLSRRMFRGAGRAVAISRGPSPSTPYENSIAFSFADAPLQGSTTLVDAAKTEMCRQVYPKYYDRVHRRQKWKFDGIAIRRFNSAKFSDVVSRVLNRPVRLDCLNLFAYLVQKQQLNFKSHQNNF